MGDDNTGQAAQLELLARAFDAIGAADMDALRDLYRADYVLELPYSPGGPMSVEGRDAALAYVGEALNHVRFTLTMREVHPSGDPDLVIAEYDSDGQIVATGDPYRNAYIGLWWFRDGRITRTREFYNPQAMG